MFEINRIDHISLIVDEVETVVQFFESLLGFRVGSSFIRSGYSGIDMEIPGTKGISIEILKNEKNDVSNAHSLINKKISVHHVGLQVENLPLMLSSVNDLYIKTLAPMSSNKFVPFEPNLRPDGEGSYLHISPGWKDESDFYYEIFDGNAQHLPNYFLDNTTQGIGIKKLSAWAHVSNHDDSLSDWYEKIFGLEATYFWNPSPTDYSFSVQTFRFPNNKMNVEILKPLKTNSYVQKFLQDFGCTIHHISFEVANIDFVSKVCKQYGIQVFGLHSGFSKTGNWNECFIAPPQIRGLLIHFYSWNTK